MTDKPQWIPPPNLSQSDEDWLDHQAVVIEAIQAKSYLEMGQVLVGVKEILKGAPKAFESWVDRKTSLTKSAAERLIGIAEKARELPGYGELTRDYKQTIVSAIGKFPKSFIKDIIDLSKTEGIGLSATQIDELRTHPYVQSEELVRQAKRYQQQLRQMLADDPTLEEEPTRVGNDRFLKALEQLKDSKKRIAELEEEGFTREAFIKTFTGKYRELEVKLEQATSSEEGRIKGELGKIQIQLHEALNGMLATLDRYEVNRDHLKPEAAKQLQDKLDLLYAKLRRTQATE